MTLSRKELRPAGTGSAGLGFDGATKFERGLSLSAPPLEAAGPLLSLEAVFLSLLVLDVAAISSERIE
jgi:hypothetical protein